VTARVTVSCQGKQGGYQKKAQTYYPLNVGRVMPSITQLEVF